MIDSPTAGMRTTGNGRAWKSRSEAVQAPATVVVEQERRLRAEDADQLGVRRMKKERKTPGRQVWGTAWRSAKVGHADPRR